MPIPVDPSSAKRLRDEATRLMATSPLIPILEKLGRVRIHGSYETNLMTWRELDVTLGVPDPSMSLAFDVCSLLAKEITMTRCMVINSIDFDPGFARIGISLTVLVIFTLVTFTKPFLNAASQRYLDFGNSSLTRAG